MTAHVFTAGTDKDYDPHLARANNYVPHLARANNYVPHLAPANNCVPHLAPANNCVLHLARANNYVPHLAPANNYVPLSIIANTPLQNFLEPPLNQGQTKPMGIKAVPWGSLLQRGGASYYLNLFKKKPKLPQNAFAHLFKGVSISLTMKLGLEWAVKHSNYDHQKFYKLNILQE